MVSNISYFHLEPCKRFPFWPIFKLGWNSWNQQLDRIGMNSIIFLNKNSLGENVIFGPFCRGKKNAHQLAWKGWESNDHGHQLLFFPAFFSDSWTWSKKSQPNPGNWKSTTKKTHANLHILHLPSACELMASGLEAGLRVLSMRHIFWRFLSFTF